MDDIVWDAPEFEHQERGIFWYYAVGAIAIILVLLALWQGNFLFAVFALVAGTTLLLVGQNHPPHHRITFAGRVITIGKSGSYPIEDFSGFVVHESRQMSNEWGKVLLRPKRRFRLYFPLMVPPGKIGQVKDHLDAHMPELEHEPSLTEELVKFFKL